MALTLLALLSSSIGRRTFPTAPQTTADVRAVSVKVTASEGKGGSLSDTCQLMAGGPCGALRHAHRSRRQGTRPQSAQTAHGDPARAPALRMVTPRRAGGRRSPRLLRQQPQRLTVTRPLY